MTTIPRNHTKRIAELTKTLTRCNAFSRHNPYGAAKGTADEGFFAGSGGDGSVEDALSEAGWRHTWRKAHYYWVMQAPNGDKITYVEGDIYRGDVAMKGN